jgi:hypothetical protein
MECGKTSGWNRCNCIPNIVQTLILRSDLEHGNDATRLFERTSAIVVKMMLNHSESELVMRRRNYLSRPKSSGTNVYPTMLKKYNETSLIFLFAHSKLSECIKSPQLWMPRSFFHSNFISGNQTATNGIWYSMGFGCSLDMPYPGLGSTVPCQVYPDIGGEKSQHLCQAHSLPGAKISRT